MKEIEVGEIITLEDQREFICMKKIQDGGKNYLFLMSNFKPLEVFFAQEITEGEGPRIRKIEDPEEKKRLLPLFDLGVSPEEKQEPQKQPEQVQTLSGEACEAEISVGEFVELENMGTYMCLRKLQDGGKEYLLMASKSNIREGFFAETVVVDGILSISRVTDTEIQQRLMKLARKNPLDAFKQIWQKKPEKNGNMPKKKRWWKR